MHLSRNKYQKLALFFAMVSTAVSLAQEVPPPKPKPVTPAASSAPKAKPKVTPPSQPTYTLVVRVDVDCNVSVDGGDTVVVHAGKASRFPSGAGQHLVQAETVEGGIKSEQSVDQKEQQMVVEMNLAPQIASLTEKRQKEQASRQALQQVIGRWAHASQWSEQHEGHYDKTVSRQLDLALGGSTTVHDIKTVKGHGAPVDGTSTWFLSVSSASTDQVSGNLVISQHFGLSSGTKYDDYYDGEQYRTSANKTLYYSFVIYPADNGQLAFSRKFIRCDGDCTSDDRGGSGQDMTGTVEIRSNSQIALYNQNLNPNPKIFDRQ